MAFSHTKAETDINFHTPAAMLMALAFSSGWLCAHAKFDRIAPPKWNGLNDRFSVSFPPVLPAMRANCFGFHSASLPMNGNFNPEELAILQAALDQACHELKLTDAATDDRYWLARMILNFSRYGDLGVEEMKSYAVKRYRGRTPAALIYVGTDTDAPTGPPPLDGPTLTADGGASKEVTGYQPHH